MLVSNIEFAEYLEDKLEETSEKKTKTKYKTNKQKKPSSLRANLVRLLTGFISSSEALVTSLS